MCYLKLADKSCGRVKLHVGCLVLALSCHVSNGIAQETLTSSPNQRFVVKAQNGIQINDREAKKILTLDLPRGSSKMRAFWAPQSDKVLLSAKNRNGFALFGAQLQGPLLERLKVPDPGNELYDLMERRLGVKIGNGPGTYRVYSEELLDLTWTGSSAVAHEVWYLAENLGEGSKSFKFNVVYSFGAGGIRITAIQPSE